MKRLLTLILLCAAVCSASTTSINRISQVLTLTGAQTNMVEWNVPYTPDAVVLTCTSGSVRVWAARAQNIVRIAGVATTNDSGAWLDTGASAQWSPDGYGTCWLASTGTSAVVTLDVIGKRGDSGEEIQAALAGYATATDIAGATNAAVMRGNPLSVNGMTFGVAYQGTVATTQPGTDPSLGSAGCAQTSSVPGYTINSSGAYEYYEGWIQYCYSNSAGSLVYGAELGIDMMTSQNVDCTVYTRVLAMPATACGLGVRFRYAGISNGYWFKATVFRTSSAAMQTLPISFERTYPGSLIFNETTKPIASNPFSITASFTANRISNVIVNVDTSANPSAVATVGQFTGGTNAVTLHANAISNAAAAAYVKRDGTTPMTAALNAGGFPITNVAAPPGALSAVNRIYADGLTSSVVVAGAGVGFLWSTDSTGSNLLFWTAPLDGATNTQLANVIVRIDAATNSMANVISVGWYTTLTNKLKLDGF